MPQNHELRNILIKKGLNLFFAVGMPLLYIQGFNYVTVNYSDLPTNLADWYCLAAPVQGVISLWNGYKFFYGKNKYSDQPVDRDNTIAQVQQKPPRIGLFGREPDPDDTPGSYEIWADNTLQQINAERSRLAGEVNTLEPTVRSRAKMPNVFKSDQIGFTDLRDQQIADENTIRQNNARIEQLSAAEREIKSTQAYIRSKHRRG